jgi:hypothetical protein
MVAETQNLLAAEALRGGKRYKKEKKKTINSFMN